MIIDYVSFSDVMDWGDANIKKDEKMRAKFNKIEALVKEQAEDEGLWSVPAKGKQRIAEARLQKALRDLHRLIDD